jgi:dTDP-glucose pyrophosphorylase
MIQRVIENYASLPNKKFVFIVNKSDCVTFYLDNVLSLLTDKECAIVKLSRESQGALCSVLMAIEHIDSKHPLIIANGDQIIDTDMSEVTQRFSDAYDAGVVTFESVHPKWSFVRIDANDMVVEAAEKRPISKKAIAGFYYFSKGADFINSAMRTIAKNSIINGKYYIAPSLNEMILANKRIGYFQVENSAYHPLYSPQKIKEYEKEIYA